MKHHTMCSIRFNSSKAPLSQNNADKFVKHLNLFDKTTELPSKAGKPCSQNYREQKANSMNISMDKDGYQIPQRNKENIQITCSVWIIYFHIFYHLSFQLFTFHCIQLYLKYF